MYGLQGIGWRTLTLYRESRKSTLLARLMSNRAKPVIRCPYCRVESEFRPMQERVEGWFRCESCGHDVMPLDPEFQCTCSKCAAVFRSLKLPGSL